MARIADLLAAGRTFSFEFFPPKDDATQLTLGHTIAELEPLQPELRVGHVRGRRFDPRAHPQHRHLGRQGDGDHADGPPHLPGPRAQPRSTRSSPTTPPPGSRTSSPSAAIRPPTLADRPSDYTYASDLFDHVVEAGDFSIGVAAHPEVHPKSPDRETDRRHLAAKLARADFAITQFFFEARHYVRLVDELAELGVDKPVIPGIMPITNLKQIARMAQLSGADVPAWVVDTVSEFEDPADVRRAGVEIASTLCAELSGGWCAGFALLHDEPLDGDS